MGVDRNVILLVIMQASLFFDGINGDEWQTRDFGVYHPPEHPNPVYGYPPGYYPVINDESFYVDNPGQGIMNKIIYFIVINLGILGIIKAFAVSLLALFAIKIPIVLLKALLLKSLILPVFAFPMLLNYYTNIFDKDDSTKPATENPMKPAGGDGGTSGGRKLNEDENPVSVAWRSIQMFTENEQCMERIYCVLGATKNDSYLGTILSRALKFLSDTMTSSTNQNRIKSLMKAYNRGQKTLKCPKKEFKCQTPEITIQQGSKKVKIF